MTYEYYKYPRETSGVYILTNKINGKQYIGQSWDITYRWSSHKSEKRYPTFPLYRAIKKYGWDNFEKEILVIVGNQEDMDRYECLLIESMNTMTPSGYNCKDGGGGKRTSEETKAKLSAAAKGKPKSPETRAKMAEANRKKAKDPEFLKRVQEGRKNWKGHTEESKQKIREARAKQVVTEEHRKAMSDSQKGRKHSEESKKKMSESRKGKPKTPEHLAAIAAGRARKKAEREALKQQQGEPK